jgi:UDP-2,3-diacylglucosamine hydrolase
MNFLHAVFTNKVLQWFFSRLHPNGAFAFAHRGRLIIEKLKFISRQTTWAMKKMAFAPCSRCFANSTYRLFLFWTQTCSGIQTYKRNITYVNLGNWITNTSYAVFDGTELKLEIFKPELHPASGIVR